MGVSEDVLCREFIQKMADGPGHDHRKNGRDHHEGEKPDGDADDLSSDPATLLGFPVAALLDELPLFDGKILWALEQPFARTKKLVVRQQRARLLALRCGAPLG